MMRLLTLFLILVVVLVIMWFFIQNMDQVVEEFQIFQLTYYRVNLINIMFGVFIFGSLLGYLLPVFQYLGAKGETRRLKRETNKLRAELNDLRNLSVEPDIEEHVSALPQKTTEDTLPAPENDETTEKANT